MPAPNVYDTTYVNSGPGVGLSSRSSGSSNSFSKGSGAYAGTSINSAAADYLAASVANQAHTGTSPYAQAIRDHFSNPMTSARSAMDYDDFISEYGTSFDMDEYYDRMLEMADYNNSWSADQAKRQMDFQRESNKAAMAFSADQAKKQMEYQTKSNQLAMNWSAAEAAKSRSWTEKLSNTAHQREVKDLIAAGLNPILAANGGAYSGSGATGQAFSSSGSSASGVSSNGAMGQTDMSATGALGNMMSGILTTARDLAITKLGIAQQKYNTDMNYAMAKMSTEASIYNNNNSVSASKAIAKLNADTDIQKSNIQAAASRYGAAVNAGAITSAAATNAAAARYSAEQHRLSSNYSADRNLESTKYQVDHNWKSNPVGYVGSMASSLANAFSDINNTYSPGFANPNLLGSE